LDQNVDPCLVVNVRIGDEDVGQLVLVDAAVAHSAREEGHRGHRSVLDETNSRNLLFARLIFFIAKCHLIF
jgi:hypothetical protein